MTLIEHDHVHVYTVSENSEPATLKKSKVVSKKQEENIWVKLLFVDIHHYVITFNLCLYEVQEKVIVEVDLEKMEIVVLDYAELFSIFAVQNLVYVEHFKILHVD